MISCNEQALDATARANNASDGHSYTEDSKLTLPPELIQTAAGRESATDANSNLKHVSAGKHRQRFLVHGTALPTGATKVYGEIFKTSCSE